MQVNAIVDVKSFTAMSLKAEIFTEGPEDKSIWEKFKDFAKDPSSLKDIPGIPEEVTKGLKTVSDAIEKIEETKAEIEKGLEDAKKLKEDLESLWTVVEACAQDGLTRETYETACEELGKTNITGELMDMLHLTEDTDLSVEYVEGLSDLMDRYSELMEKETDWVTLVEKEIFTRNTPECYGVVIGIQGKFMVRADLNLAIGSNLQYEVGKRYNFWFRFGLFKPSSGSSSMDLIDESFAFQFYVMGRLGIKAGVRLKLFAAIGSVDAVSVGLTTELGPYIKMWGFFIYDYSKYRPTNTKLWSHKEQMAGALYLEFGLYLMVGIEAKALFLEYDKDFVDKEYPLLEAGGKDYYYEAAYEPLDDSDEIVVYNDGSAAPQPGCAVSMVLPEDAYALKYIDLTTGKQGARSLNFDNYTFKVSNPNFRVDNVDGKPVVSVISIPQNVRLMQCDLTVTYKHGKLAFSSYDMSATVHLAWTNMTAAEYQQVFTATVTIPDGNGGREAIWSKRVRKGTPFDLPSEEEIQKLLSWSDAKYVSGSGYGGRATEGVTLIENTQYNYDLGYQTYHLTVTGIEGGGSRTFTGRYGEPFDFSSLTSAGANGPDRYTRFSGLMMNGEPLALNQPINSKFASSNNAVAAAQYENETVTATFEFTGVEHDAIEVTLRSGGTPDTSAVMAAVDDGVTVKGFYPQVGPIDGDMTYQVVCETPESDTPDVKALITFESNGGSRVEPMEKTVGGVFGSLPTTTRKGYGFDGWFTDDGTFENAVDANYIVTGDVTLYAGWTQGSVTVTFNTNGGLNLEDNTKNVACGVEYGELPTPERSGYGFRGWHTAADETGEEVTADTIVDTTEDHTLYAHWVELKTIPANVFDFEEEETFTYERDTPQPAVYAFTPEDGETYAEDSFTIKYTRVSDEFIGENLDVGAEPVMAGTYNVTITRAADDTYAKFDETYTDVLVIDRAERDLSGIANDDLYFLDRGLTQFYVCLTSQCRERIGVNTNSKQLNFEYVVTNGSKRWRYNNKGADNRLSVLIYDLAPGATYTITKVKINGDVNYLDAESDALSGTFNTKKAPTKTADQLPYNSYGKTVKQISEDIKKALQSSNTYTLHDQYDLLAFARLVNNGYTCKGKTIKLGESIWNVDCIWTPISSTFEGTFNGNGRVIRGLYNSQGGLFTRLGSNAVIENVTLEDCYLLYGIAYRGGKIRNCTSNATLSRGGSAQYRITWLSPYENCNTRPIPTQE